MSNSPVKEINDITIDWLGRVLNLCTGKNDVAVVCFSKKLSNLEFLIDSHNDTCVSSINLISLHNELTRHLL